MTPLVDRYELSPIQAGMLFNSLMSAGSGVDIEQVLVRGIAAPDAAAWWGAWQALLARHEILRTSFQWQGVAVPTQVISPNVSIPHVTVDLRNETDPEAALQAWLARDRTTDLDLSRAPLMRVAILQMAEREWVMVWTFHHALLDGRSFPVLLRELHAIFEARSRGHEPRLSTPATSFRNYIEWLRTVDFASAEPYWRKALAGFRAPTPLVIDRSPKQCEGPVQGVVEVALDEDLTAHLERRAKQSEVTVNTLLQAAWVILLHRYSGEEDIVIGATRACRHFPVPDSQTLVGIFINTLPLRALIPANGGIEPLLRSLRAQSIEQRLWEHTPLVQVQAWSDVPRGTSLFESVVVFDTASLDARMKAADHAGMEYEYRGQTNFPLTLIAYGGARMTVRLEYQRARFDDEAARRMHGHLLSLLDGLADASNATIGQLTLLSDTERQMALYGWNPSTDIPAGKTLVDVFSEQVARSPRAIAITFDGQQISYEELDRRSNQVANTLLARGAAAGQLVALRVERSEAVVVGILGILKAGCAYLPLDPVYPRERIAFMLEDSEVRLALTEDAFIADFQSSAVEALAMARMRDASATKPVAVITPGSLAYVIYTSGSTGKPKGCRLTHFNVVRLMQSTHHWFGFDADDVWTLFHSYSFDWTVFEIWGALSYGGRLVVVPSLIAKLPDEFRALVESEGVTVLCQTPSAFKSFIQADSELDAPRYALRYVIFGGEALELQSLSPWMQRYGDQRPSLVNMYGITETTVHVTYRPLSRADVQAGKGSVVGVPIPDLQLYILDRYGHPAPIGVPGEIHVGGAGVALGYLNREELTAQRFVDDPFRQDRRQKMYRSGDVARRLADGDVECLGRLDDQVKIRGFRIELGEIESQIASHPEVQAVCVMAREDVPGDKRLAAYVVARTAADEKLSATIKSRLREKLPQYMVPADIVFLTVLPLTSNGKVDRRALPAPSMNKDAARRRIVPPGTPFERSLVDIWKAVLRVPEVSTDDNFFALGGDSILIIQIISRCRDAGIQVTPRMIFDHPVLADLAKVASPIAAKHVIASVADTVGAIPLSPIQSWFVEQRFADANYWNQAFLFRLRETIDPGRLQRALDALIGAHEALRLRLARKPEGWHQSVEPSVRQIELHQVDLSQVPESELASEIESHCTRIQSSLRIDDGPLLVSALLRCGAARGDRLLIAVHHLGIDGVSWRTLLEDLEGAYRDADPAAIRRERGTSFRRWVQALQDFAASPEARSSIEYWRGIQQRPAAETGTESGTRMIETTIDASLTRRLLTDLPRLFRAQANDVLLAALLLAQRAKGAATLSIDLEGHGREDVVGDFDLSRTIGWFTAMFPLELAAPEQGGVLDTLLAVKERIRAVPHRGLSFGVLRSFSTDAQLRSELSGLPAAEILFNYLGQMDALLSGLRMLEFAPEAVGPWHGPRNRRTHAIEVLAAVRDGRLVTQWSYDPSVTSAERVASLATQFGRSLEELGRLTEANPLGARSASDFPLTSLTQADVDELWRRYPGLQDAYPLSPMQKLFYSLESGGNPAGLEQWQFRARGSLDADRLKAAVHSAVQGHSVFRSAFVGDIGRAPLQVVRESAPVEWIVEDLRPLTAAERQQHIAGRIAENAQRRSSLDGGAPLRFDLLRTADDEHHLLWTTHHLCVDGWSWPLVFSDIVRAYNGDTGSSGSRFGDYIRWLAKGRPDSAGFWKQYLQGYEQPLPLRLFEADPRSGSGNSEEIVLDAAQTAALVQVARACNVTLNTCVQWAWAVVLSYACETRDVVFGASFTGRPPELPGISGLVGPCVTNLPVRMSFADGQSIQESLQQLHRCNSELSLHQYSSPEEIQTHSAVAWRHRLFESLIVFQNYQYDRDALRLGHSTEFSVLDAPESTAYALTLAVTPAEQMRIRFLRNASLMDSQSVRVLAEAMRATLAGIASRSVPDRMSVARLLPADMSGQARRVARALTRPTMAVAGGPQLSPTEALVADVWKSLFGVQALPVTGNFFDLGGHSIMLMRAHREICAKLGRDIPVVTFLQHPTIQALAKALDGNSDGGKAVEDAASRARRQLEAMRQRQRPKVR